MVGPTDRLSVRKRCLFFGDELGYALTFVDGYLGLPNDFFAYGRGGDAFVGAVKDADIKFVFKFLQEVAQCRLGDFKFFGRPCKIAEAINGDYVSELLKCHFLMIDFMNANIAYFVCR